jgi:biotin operon repressor
MWIVEQDYNITYYAETPSTLEFPEGTAIITTKADLDALGAKMTREQLQDWYNTIPGEAAVKRLRNRPTAIERIWKAMQKLAGVQVDPTAEGPNVEAEPEVPNTKPKKVAKAKAVKAAKVKKPKKAATAKTEKAPRDGSKKQKLIAMISRKSGATGEELQEAFGWLPHTVRGALSTLRSKGVGITTEKNQKGETVYHAA